MMEENVNAEPADKIAEAKVLVERLEKANAEKAKLLEREERLLSEKLLSGRAEAGVPAPKPVEETPQQYAARVMRGEL